MATRWIQMLQTWRERREEPGTALLALLMLGLGLLLALVSLLHYVMLSLSSHDAHTHQLACQQWHILDDGQPDPPLSIFSQLHYGRKE